MGALEDTLAALQQQGLAANPYAQFGSAMGQAKNVYIGDDPYKALAANAAQSFIAGLAGGYGQGQVKQDLAKVPGLIPQLYANPTQVVNPGIDSGSFNALQIAAQADIQQQARDIYQAGLIEREKQQYNPAVPGMQADAALKQMDLLAQLEKRKAFENARTLQQSAPSVPTSQAASGGVVDPVTPQTVLNPQAPTAKPAGQGQVGRSLPEFLAQFRSAALPDMESQQKADAAAMEAYQAEQNNLATQKANQDKITADKLATEQTKFNEELRNSSSAINTLDTTISKLQSIIPNIPDYGAPFVGEYAKLKDEIVARTPLGKFDDAAQKRLVAASTLDAITPKFAGEIIKAALPGPLTEKELAFVIKALPGENKTQQQNQAIVDYMTVARDLGKFENAFKQAGVKSKLTPPQINQLWEKERARLGGSFLLDGKVNPEVYKKTDFLNNLLGGTI